MPKRTDIKKILIIGAGPIVIGQGCEFDYSGTQACKALKEEGYNVILINSNPATIMTDPDFADRTYIEPINPEVVEKIIAKERPDALLPTMGGQTALNTAKTLAESGVLERYGVKLIGANLQAINKAEDRELFKEAMNRIGLEMPRSAYVHSFAEAMHAIEPIGFPAIIRPSFTLGGTGANIAYNREEFEGMIKYALEVSPVGETLIDESIMGWKEYELEVMRDTKDNVVIICSIENFDPMGVHTGDSITVAPAQTLTDKEYQIMRDAAIKIIREIGVDTGGSNVQFGVNPKDGRLVVIEMNPRVSRSSALASKATGFPIAKIAAKLAVGFTLDEIRNDITRETPASFEPTIDYVVVKIPRFTFEKFPAADATLMTQMKSVGEAMSIGRTFKESLQKAMRSLEIGTHGFETKWAANSNYLAKMGISEIANMELSDNDRQQAIGEEKDRIKDKLRTPNWERLWYIGDALRGGGSIDEIFEITKIDRWFLEQIKEIIEFEQELLESGVRSQESGVLRRAKELGFSDRRLAELTHTNEPEIRRLRKESGIEPVFKRVDTCAAEFEAHTPYLYSTYERPFYNIADNAPAFGTPSLLKRGLGGVAECEAKPTDRKKIMILGGGPNRIGQGIEFDYCCVHAAFALREDGFETIMVNCNPETVSTDYDTSDRLYFEPLTFEDVMNIVEKERPDGVIVQFGGQTPLKLAVALSNAFEEMKKQGGKEVKIIGTSPESIDIAEDRYKFRNLLNKLGLCYPEGFDVRPNLEASAQAGTLLTGTIEDLARQTGFPLIVRPSYVLGGRAMAIVYDELELRGYLHKLKFSPEKDLDIYADRFLNDAIEVDVDCISDGETIVVAGIMEHIEEAGIHSGDSACSLPPYSLDKALIEEIARQTKALARELKVIGLMNIQFAIQDGTIYILEVNPRASRTVPFVSKAIGVPLAKLAARVMAGKSLKELGFTKEIVPVHVSVKEAVFPFIKFPGVDTILGPEMKSTGEVMGIDNDFGKAFGKAQIAAGVKLPLEGKVFISVKDSDKRQIAELSKKLHEMGFTIVATKGTSNFLNEHGISNHPVLKVAEGRPHVVDSMKSGDIQMVINTSFGAKSVKDSYDIRRTALTQNIAYYTTVAGAKATASAIDALKRETLDVKPIQEYHKP